MFTLEYSIELSQLKGKQRRLFSEFHHAMSGFLESRGAVAVGEGNYQTYKLDTIAGPLEISISSQINGPGALLCRFVDVDRAISILNPSRDYNHRLGLSGKWNFHYFDGWNVENAVVHFGAELDRILEE